MSNSAAHQEKRRKRARVKAKQNRIHRYATQIRLRGFRRIKSQ